MNAIPPALPRIPAPFRRWWREIRIRVMPVIVFGLLAAVAAVFWWEVVVPKPCAEMTNSVTEQWTGVDSEDDCPPKEPVGSNHLLTNSVLEPDLPRD
jgi:hypothetical protein